MEIKDLELAVGNCCECVFCTDSRDCYDIMEIRFGIDYVDLNEELGDCADNGSCWCYKLKQKT